MLLFYHISNVMAVQGKIKFCFFQLLEEAGVFWRNIKKVRRRQTWEK
jgi:hypothetical protein